MFKQTLLVFATFGLMTASCMLRADLRSKESPTMPLFYFEDPAESSWRIVNDGVMGGRSKGYREISDGAMRFDGTLVTDGGGFTSVWTRREVDLSGFDGLEMRVRGNGRSFEVEVNDGQRYGWRNVSRRIPFDTTEEWRIVRVPFSNVRSTVFGEPVEVPPIDLATIERVGFYILDGIDGPFWLEVDTVGAYRE